MSNEHRHDDDCPWFMVTSVLGQVPEERREEVRARSGELIRGFYEMVDLTERAWSHESIEPFGVLGAVAALLYHLMDGFRAKYQFADERGESSRRAAEHLVRMLVGSMAPQPSPDTWKYEERDPKCPYEQILIYLVHFQRDEERREVDSLAQDLCASFLAASQAQIREAMRTGADPANATASAYRAIQTLAEWLARNLKIAQAAAAAGIERMEGRAHE